MTIPAARAAVLAVSVVELFVRIVAAVVPNFTLVTVLRLVPLMVTVVPPSVDPLDGETPVIRGTGSTVVMFQAG